MDMKRFMRRAGGGALSLLFGMVSLSAPAGQCQSAQPGIWTRDQQPTRTQQSATMQQQVRMPQQFRLPPQTRAMLPTYNPRQPYESDILLVRPAQGANGEEIADVLSELHGTLMGSVGEGTRKVLIVKTEKGKLLETEQKLRKDKHFSGMQRNYIGRIQSDGSGMRPLDSGFCDQWHLNTLHIPKAWSSSTGAGQRIAVFDTGCSGDVFDLRSKVLKGQDAAGVCIAAMIGAAVGGPAGAAMAREFTRAANRGGARDEHGHGTQVATIAAGYVNNPTPDGKGNVVGVAPDAKIEPVLVTDPFGVNPEPNDLTILEGLDWAIKNNVKIIVISSNMTGDSLANKYAHDLVHQTLREYHAFGGLVFLAAGNEGSNNGAAEPLPYLIVVSGINKQLQLAAHSNFGGPTWFGAPSEGIVCVTKDGQQVAVSGTSFATPMIAGIAALIWSQNPGMSNTEVERRLIDSCQKANSPGLGYGIPDAEKAVKG